MALTDFLGSRETRRQRRDRQREAAQILASERERIQSLERISGAPILSEQHNEWLRQHEAEVASVVAGGAAGGLTSSRLVENYISTDSEQIDTSTWASQMPQMSLETPYNRFIAPQDGLYEIARDGREPLRMVMRAGEVRMLRSFESEPFILEPHNAEPQRVNVVNGSDISYNNRLETAIGIIKRMRESNHSVTLQEMDEFLEIEGEAQQEPMQPIFGSMEMASNVMRESIVAQSSIDALRDAISGL